MRRNGYIYSLLYSQRIKQVKQKQNTFFRKGSSIIFGSKNKKKQNKTRDRERRM